jgi:monofunctional biosynthetic peptidoglycan transglycosylase
MRAGKARRRWRAWLWKLPLLLASFSVAQVLALRFIDPPFSMFMLARQLDAVVEGDFRFRIVHDWRDMSNISPSLPLAVVASEDQNFAHHHGFDFDAIEKAQAHNERMTERAEKRGKPVRRLRGASTISQQTAKNLFLWSGGGWTRMLRKGVEVWYTALIELFWPKQRILEVYVNIAEVGDGVYGAQAASRNFFHKDAARLTPGEAARLAAVLPSPKRYDAARPGPYVQRRADAIQRQMRQIGGPAYLRTLD